MDLVSKAQLPWVDFLRVCEAEGVFVWNKHLYSPTEDPHLGDERADVAIRRFLVLLAGFLEMLLAGRAAEDDISAARSFVMHLRAGFEGHIRYLREQRDIGRPIRNEQAPAKPN